MDRVSGPDAERTLGAAIAEHREALAGVGSLAEPLAAAADAIATSLAAGGRCSRAATAAPLPTRSTSWPEFVGRYLKERAPYPAIALTANTSALTAIGTTTASTRSSRGRCARTAARATCWSRSRPPATARTCCARSRPRASAA